MFIAPVQAKSLELSLHALLLARIRLAGGGGGEGKRKRKKKALAQKSQTCPQLSTADEFADWFSHTYNWFFPGKTSPLLQIPPLPLVTLTAA